MAKCRGCIHKIVCDREAGYGYSVCPDFIATKDVVEVVRCMDCVLHEEGCPLDTHPYMTDDDGYCYLGKPKKMKGGAE